MTPDWMIEAQRLMAERDAARQEIGQLTKRQIEVVTYITKGFRAREISVLMGCSDSSVMTHIARASKTLATDHRGLLVLGVKAGLA